MKKSLPNPISKHFSSCIELSFTIFLNVIVFTEVLRFKKIFIFILLVFLMSCCILAVSGENFDADVAKTPIAIQGMAETQGINIMLYHSMQNYLCHIANLLKLIPFLLSNHSARTTLVC